MVSSLNMQMRFLSDTQSVAQHMLGVIRPARERDGCVDDTWSTVTTTGSSVQKMVETV